MYPSLAGQVAIVTGAGSGIGKAIALALGSQGATLALVGRRRESLEHARVGLATSTVSRAYICDLASDDEIARLHENFLRDFTRLDILIHSAGFVALGMMESAAVEEFDRHYRINARAPYLLTQRFLPLLKQAKGQIVFINSSVGVRTKEHTAAYAASKHALKAIADTLRMEVNAAGVRVLSVFPGNTATPMQTVIQEYTGRTTTADYLLQPDDVASMAVHALLLPRTAEVTDIHIRPFQKLPA
jgi:NAD(P)-dependent dehydrogenase (short-subunit alcohol dehydrogenase family)